jgi:phage gp46-like protein
MTFVRIRDAEACAAQPLLLWDTIWVERLDASGGYGDWLLAGQTDQAASRGGLRSEAALHTATLIQLFTDARAPEGAALPAGDGDRRGWWGDSIRIDGEPAVPLGSLIWIEVERAALTEDTARRVEAHAAAALAVLADQGAVARTEVTTEVRREQGFLGLVVRHYDADGARVYDQRFGVLWRQSARDARMNF